MDTGERGKKLKIANNKHIFLIILTIYERSSLAPRIITHYKISYIYLIRNSTKTGVELQLELPC